MESKKEKRDEHSKRGQSAMKIIGLGVLSFVVSSAFADYDATHISWPGWTIKSSEETYLGKRHTSYPLLYLFDNDPNTAWVWSGRPDKWDSEAKELSKEVWHGKYALELDPTDPTQIDQIRIMNGYNKSPELFAKNDRIATIETWSWERGADRRIRRVNLADSMGWQDIKIPARKYEQLILVFTKRFPGEIHDLCISGIELYSKNKRINLHRPNMVILSDGSSCGCGTIEYAAKWNGWKSPESSEMAEFEPTGKYIAGIDDSWLWIYNTKTGKRMVHQKVQQSVWECTWINSRTLKLWGDKPTFYKVPKGK